MSTLTGTRDTNDQPTPAQHRRAWRFVLGRGLLALCLAVAAASVAPAAAYAGATNDATPADRLIDPAELEGFLDDLVARQLTEYHIPGASVAIVKDGRLLFANGYGYANLERRTPVVADQTLLRVGSVAKLFTWTAVMQLVEQG